MRIEKEVIKFSAALAPRAGGSIFITCAGEPVKIVDCFGRFHGVNHRPWRIPVGGYAEHRLGVQVSVAERGKELTRRDILEIQ